MLRRDYMFVSIDCLRLYVADLEQGIAYYKDKMKLEFKWKKDKAAGFALGENCELVIQTQDKLQEVDILVEDVLTEIEEIKKAGGKILIGPFDIDIGKAAVIEDPWKNTYVILDMSKGQYKTDEQGNVIGVEKG
jgi:lactoylglutathione lyase